MKYKKIITSVAFLLIGLVGLHAQTSLVSTGGEAVGTGGMASYSVGQIVYTTNIDTNGSTAQGVQQPYEISVTIGINERTINLEMGVFPNPTTNYLTLKVDGSNSLSRQQISYQLIDLQGKIIEKKKVNVDSTIIKMEALPKAIYFLNVIKDNQLVKTFKVIKN